LNLATHKYEAGVLSAQLEGPVKDILNYILIHFTMLEGAGPF
jgi:hypothetical protein